jgi:hypothetical protein
MEYIRRFLNFWFPNMMWICWIVIAGLGIYFFQTLIHEGTHNLTTIAASGHSPAIAPFPHIYDPDRTKTGDEGFLNGVNISIGKDGTTVTEKVPNCAGKVQNLTSLAGFPGMPQIMDLVIITALFFLFFFGSITNPIIRFPFFMWYLAAVIDFIYNTGTVAFGGCSGNDWSDVFLRGYMGQGALIGLTWVFWIVFLFSHFVWIYWAKWGKERVEGSAFPTDDDFIDGKKFFDFSKFWDFRWLAFIFGTLSYICAIWATLWIFSGGDPRVRTDSGAFIAFYVMHIVGGFGCFVVFALSFFLKKKN